MQILSSPRHLDAISRRIGIINKDLDRVTEARRKFANASILAGGYSEQEAPGTSLGLAPSTQERIDALYSFLPQLEPLLPLAPHVLTRLQCLSALHHSSANTAEDLRNAQDLQKHLVHGLESLTTTMTEVEKAAIENSERCERNLDSLIQRLNSLEATAGTVRAQESSS